MTTDKTTKRTGGCLCGSVKYRATTFGGVLQCHCVNCRRLSGNYVAAVHGPTDDLVLTIEDDQFGWFRVDEAQYGLCHACGSTMFFHADDTPDVTSIMVGTLDDATGLEVTEVWFADEAQAHNAHPPSAVLFGGNGDA